MHSFYRDLTGPSVVDFACALHLTGERRRELVISRCNHLEVFQILDEASEFERVIGGVDGDVDDQLHQDPGEELFFPSLAKRVIPTPSGRLKWLTSHRLNGVVEAMGVITRTSGRHAPARDLLVLAFRQQRVRPIIDDSVDTTGINKANGPHHQTIKQ